MISTMTRRAQILILLLVCIVPANAQVVVHGNGDQLRLYSNWTSFTPTASWSTNTTLAGKTRQVGDTVWVQYAISLSGAPDAVTLTLDPPSGFTVDTAKLIHTETPVGQWWAQDTGTSSRMGGTCVYNNGTGKIQMYICTTSPNTVTTASNTVPFTFGNTDTIDATVMLPTSTGTAATGVAYGMGSSYTSYRRWVSFTPTGVWTGNVSYTGRVRLVGDTAEVQIYCNCSGAPSAGTQALDLPSGWTMDETKFAASGSNRPITGSSEATAAGNGRFPCAEHVVLGSSAHPFIPLYRGTAPNTFNGITPTAPGTFASGDAVLMDFWFPVSTSPTATVANGCGAQLGYDPWTAFTPTVTWTSNTTVTGLWERVGDVAYRQCLSTCTAAPGPAATAYRTDAPVAPLPGANSSAQPTDGAGNPRNIGFNSMGYTKDVSAASYRGPMGTLQSGAGAETARYCGTAPNTINGPTPSQPFTYAVSDYLVYWDWYPSQ